MHLVPQSWSHWHILLSVFPSIGLLFVLAFFVTALVANNEAMKRTCLILFAVLGVLAIPTYFSGDYSMATLSGDPKISRTLMNSHFVWGLASLAALVITGVAAAVSLWRARRLGRLSDQSMRLVLALAVVTLGLVVATGELGWEINHHELRLDRAAQR